MPCSCSKHLHHEQPDQLPANKRELSFFLQLHNTPLKKKKKRCDNPIGGLDNTLAGVGSSLSFPRKSADSHTGPTTSKDEISASGEAGETSSMCCNKSIVRKWQKKSLIEKRDKCICYIVAEIRTSNLNLLNKFDTRTSNLNFLTHMIIRCYTGMR